MNCFSSACVPAPTQTTKQKDRKAIFGERDPSSSSVVSHWLTTIAGGKSCRDKDKP